MSLVSSLYSVPSKARLSFLLTLLILCKFSPSAQASGVFEFELVELQRLDSNAYNNDRVNTSGLPPVRLLVCLKEAFTSQLDGPCTFGNASLTINQHQIETAAKNTNKTLLVELVGDQISASNETTVKATSTANQMTNSRQNEHQQQQTVASTEWDATSPLQQTLVAHRQERANYLQLGSPLTNVVRILFTFRWTKSFTIILTAEQITPNEPQPSVNTARLDSNHHHHLQTSRLKLLNGSSSGGDNKTTAVNLLELVPMSNRSSADKNLVLTTQATTSVAFIDRHVLTENEVLPNLENNPNKPWTSRFSRSLKSSLFYRFRVFCALNYYGDGCTAFCRPRDDQFGHYNCSSTGQKICLDGWTGPDCDKAKCRPGCNQQHGYCDQPDTCQCRPGWTGLRCDECITYPGCQNGFCIAPWQCICQQYWGGVYCDQDLNYCGSHDPCRNNGTCQNVNGGRYKCHCDSGFTGVNCEIKLDASPGDNSNMADGLRINGVQLTQLSAGCAVNACLNGGTCLEFNNQQLLDESASVSSAATTVVGADGHHTISEQNFGSVTGDNELQQDVEHMIISNPVLDGHRYRCQCPTGWVGDFCQWSDSSLTNSATEILAASTNGSVASVDDNKPSPLSVDIGELSVSTHLIDDVHWNQQQKSNPDSDRMNSSTQSFITTVLENVQPTTTAQHLDMRHLISGVLVASVVGVFLAALMLTWCCLIAIEQNKFSFIQMNIVRRGDNGDGNQQTVSTLRRMQAKIRDSLRYSPRAHAKSEPQNNEDVLKPPPSYEESNHFTEKIYDISQKNNLLAATEHVASSTSVSDVNNLKDEDEKLVVRGALHREVYASRQRSIKLSQFKSAITNEKLPEPNTTSQHLMNNPFSACPKHGHLYITSAAEKDFRESNDCFEVTVPPTTIEIEYKPNDETPLAITDRCRRSDEATTQLDRNQLKSHEHYHDYPNGFV